MKRLKEILEKEDSKLLREFIASVIGELKSDIKSNWRILKDILYRWSLINKFNTNKRLQLEAGFALLNIKETERMNYFY